MINKINYYFDNIAFPEQKDEIQNLEEWEILLKFVTTFGMKVNNILVFEEPYFPVVELCKALQFWLKNKIDKENDFIYTSIEHNEPGLLWYKKINSKWYVGSIWEKNKQNIEFKLSELCKSSKDLIIKVREEIKIRYNLDILNYIETEV